MNTGPRRRSDPGKLASAARLRSETTLPIKWIAGYKAGYKILLSQVSGGKFPLYDSHC